MNIAEAMQALLDGKKIRLKNWKPGQYIYMFEGESIFNENNQLLHIGFVTDSDLEIYEEPTTDCEFIINRETFYTNETEIAKCTKHAKDDPNCELNENSEPKPKFKIGDRVRIINYENNNVYIVGGFTPTHCYFGPEHDKFENLYPINKIEKVEEEKTDIPPMPVKEITQEDFKKKYPDVEKEEWTYPCVVRHKETKELLIAFDNYLEQRVSDMFCYRTAECPGDSYRVDAKSSYIVIADDLGNLDL